MIDIVGCKVWLEVKSVDVDFDMQAGIWSCSGVFDEKFVQTSKGSCLDCVCAISLSWQIL